MVYEWGMARSAMREEQKQEVLDEIQKIIDEFPLNPHELCEALFNKENRKYIPKKFQRIFELFDNHNTRCFVKEIVFAQTHALYKFTETSEFSPNFKISKICAWVYEQAKKGSCLDLSHVDLPKLTFTQLTALWETLKDSGITSLVLKNTSFLILSTDARWNLSLAHLKTFRFLDLSSNSLHTLPTKYALRLKELLEALPDHTLLDLSDNAICEMLPQVLKSLLSGLKTTRTTSVNLSSNNLSEMPSSDLEQFFDASPSIKSLSLKANWLYQLAKHTNRFSSFCNWLEKCSLTSIDLSSNELSNLNEDELKALGTALRQCESVNLSWNNLTAPQATAFVNASMSSSIKKLDLSNNNFDSQDDQLVAFADALTASSLQTMDLSSNYIAFNQMPKGEWTKICGGLNRSKITSLNMSGNDLSEEQCEELRKILIKNQKVSFGLGRRGLNYLSLFALGLESLTPDQLEALKQKNNLVIGYEEERALTSGSLRTLINNP